MYTDYILFSSKLDKYYVGQTCNYEARINFHNNPELNRIWTRKGIPWEIKVKFSCNNRAESVGVEKFINQQQSRSFIKLLIEERRIR